jgi:hypothetical protein
MRGGSANLALIGAFAAAPLLGERRGDTYDLIKPLTRLVIAVDPDRGFASKTEIAAKRTLILEEIGKVVEAQGAAALDPDDVSDLVHLRVWDSCFEFSHFTDAELADGIIAVHHDRGGLTRDRLIRAIGIHRECGDDIKKLWSNWRPHVSKRALAEAMWPTLRAKVLLAVKREGPIPPIAEVADEAYQMAHELRHRRHVVRAAPH